MTSIHTHSSLTCSKTAKMRQIFTICMRHKYSKGFSLLRYTNYYVSNLTVHQNSPVLAGAFLFFGGGLLSVLIPESQEGRVLRFPVEPTEADVDGSLERGTFISAFGAAVSTLDILWVIAGSSLGASGSGGVDSMTGVASLTGSSLVDVAVHVVGSVSIASKSSSTGSREVMESLALFENNRLGYHSVICKRICL